ncbi:MAG: hypothetical protein QG629_299 [Patescibacteria group bacterium]|nr:hypothetical protein [Candidatus Saccharibacteria bacterium]MDQ5963217.1 hypothetical protein [Patescibacteria group bacterium]
MINLLPKPIRHSYSYARRNRHILRWVVVLLAGILGAILLTAFGYLYLHQLSNNYARQVETTKKQLEKQDLKKVNAKIKDMSNNLELATQVLSKQILFSELLEKLGSRLPPNTVLSGLSVSEAQGALDISAKTKDYDDATQILVNLRSKDNGIFSAVDIVSTSCTTSSDNYPCTVTLRALFAPDSKFALSNKAATPSKATKDSKP